MGTARGVRAFLLVALLGALVSSGAAPATGQEPAAPVHGITLVRDEVLPGDGRLHELTLHSEALDRDAKARILLPEGYGDPANAATRYPMLLLLHGAGSSERSWTEATRIEEQTAPLGLIVVMPEGGNLGFYTDWLDGPAWETFHLGELVPWVDATYRTVGTRAGRAVAGLSMGGFGSGTYATRHPDRFLAMASFSGALDVAGAGVAEETALKALGYADDRRWGPYLTHEANWRGHNPTDLVTNLRGMDVRVTTGTGVACPGTRDRGPDYTEAGVFAMATSFTLLLERAGIPYDEVFRTCGTHEWHYWEIDLGAWLPELMGLFVSPPPSPAAFDYRTTETTNEVWGWSFAPHRPAIEFLELRAVSPAGLTAIGSGLLDVVTAPVYPPGATYALTSTQAGTLTVPVAIVPPLGTLPATDGAVAHAVADAEGRLRFTLDLGPAHTANQFSVEAIAAELLAVGSYFRTLSVTITQVAPAPDPVAAAPSTTAPTDGRRIPATGGDAPPWIVIAALVLTAAALRAASRSPSPCS